MKFLCFLFGILSVICFITGCTYSINLVHTQGTATDVVDENQTPKADISVPISGIPKLS